MERIAASSADSKTGPHPNRSHPEWRRRALHSIPPRRPQMIESRSPLLLARTAAEPLRDGRPRRSLGSAALDEPPRNRRSNAGEVVRLSCEIPTQTGATSTHGRVGELLRLVIRSVRDAEAREDPSPRFSLGHIAWRRACRASAPARPPGASCPYASREDRRCGRRALWTPGLRRSSTLRVPLQSAPSFSAPAVMGEVKRGWEAPPCAP